MAILTTPSDGIVAPFQLAVTAIRAPYQLEDPFGFSAAGVLRPVAMALGEPQPVTAV